MGRSAKGSPNFSGIRWTRGSAKAALRWEEISELGYRYEQRAGRGTLVVGVVLLVSGRYVANPDDRAMTFFGGGFLLLAAALTAVWVWMRRTRHAEVNGRGGVPPVLVCS